MNLIIYYDGNDYQTCGWAGTLPRTPSHEYDPKLFGLPAVTEIIAIIHDWRADQFVSMPFATITLSR